MKVAQISDYGGPEVMEVVNGAVKPQAAAGQVLVEIHAASINPFDIKVREGMARQMAELNFPAILGGDFAGIVSEVGEGVTGFKAGQEVYGQAAPLSGHGSFAEYASINAGQLALKPKTTDFDTAASLPLAAVSAYQALADHLNLKSDQRILIHGGAGGIGSLAIQIAKYFGAYVATTVSTDDVDYVKSLGADEAIDYKSQDFSKTINGYDAVFDNIGSDTNKKSYAVLRPGGSLVSMVDPADEELVKDKNIIYTHQFTRSTNERLTRIAELVDTGVIKPQIDKVFSLDQIVEAMDYQQNGHPSGKVVLRIK